MDEQRNIPKLRFPGFIGSWEDKAIGEIGTILSGLTYSPSDIDEEGVLVLRSSNIRNSELSFVDNVKVIADKFNPVEEGDILICVRNGSRRLIGKNALITKEAAGLAFGAFMSVYRSRQNSFVFQLFATRPYFKKVHENLGATINSINGSDLKKFKFKIPSLPEQQKIASFLTTVDQKIQALRRKKELLQQYKKGVLQKIFSQEIRFKKEDGSDYPEWEEKRLDEFISKFIVPMRDKPKDLNGDIPWCRIEDFDGKYLRLSKSGQGVSSDTVKAMNLKIFPPGTLIVSCSAYLGRCAIVARELITNQTFIGLLPTEGNVVLDFLYHIMSKSERKLNSLSSGTTISYLSRREFEKFKVPFPCLKEQKKIANLLDAIDFKIDSVTQAILLTKTWKKGLLQKMFV